MNRIFKNITMFLAAFGLFFVLGFSSFAQGTTSIAVSKASPAVGDSTTVTVQASQSGTVTVKYTSSLLTFSSCNVSGYSAQNNTVSFSGTEGSITFTAAGAGTASIIVSSSNCAGSSTTISIGSSAATTDQTAETTEDTSTETADTAETTEEVADETASQETEDTSDTAVAASASGSLNADGGFDIDGVSYVVSERYADSEIPDGFSKTTLTIGSGTYSELTNGSVTIIYLKPADNTSGSGVFYLYNADAATVSPFLMLGSSDNYVILSDPADDTMAGMTEASIEVTGGSYSGYTSDGSEYFYVYGTNNSGYTGWFCYDATYKTVARLDTSLLSASSEETDTTATTSYDANDSQTEKLSSYRKVISFLIVLAVILVFVVINLAVKVRRARDDDFDFDFDQEDDTEEALSEEEASENKSVKKRHAKKDVGDIFAATPRKPSFKIPRSIVFADPDKKSEEDEYDDDYDYEDDDDQDVDESYDSDDFGQEDFDEDYEEEYDDYEDEDNQDSYDEGSSADDADDLQLMDLNDL